MHIWEPDLDDRSQHWRAVARTMTEEHIRPLAEELDREGRYPWENVERLVESGLGSLFVPEEYGGRNLSLSAACAVVEEVSRGCASTGAILSANALGAFPVLRAGTDEQRRTYLGGLVAGDAISFALTEVGAGSDARAIRTNATRVADGWHLKGEKIHIGNGGASRYYVVFAQQLLQENGSIPRITAFIVDKESDGVVIDRLEDKMGIRGSMTSNLKLDTVVPDDAILGEAGQGLRLALSTLNVGRVTVSAQATGLALAALEVAATEATARSTFGTQVIDHQGIGFRLADTLTHVTAARMLVYDTAAAYDRGDDISTAGAMTKLYAAEAAHQAADAAVQVHGGNGYCRPNLAERLYRDQRILEIYEGSSEIQRLVLARALKNAVENDSLIAPLPAPTTA